MARNRSSSGVETKVAAGSTTIIVAGYISWALLTYVPGLNTISPDLQGQLPVVIAFVLSSLAAYYAPHTSRPDLQPVQPVLVPPVPPVLAPRMEVPPQA